MFVSVRMESWRGDAWLVVIVRSVGGCVCKCEDRSE